MTQKEPVIQETKQHHFLFHVFKMDKAEHPMPKNQADSLMQYLKNVVVDKVKNERGRN